MMYMKKFNLNELTYDELKALHEATLLEMNKIKDDYRRELIQNVCDAMNDLHAEFPSVELRMGAVCCECGYDDDYDVLYRFCGNSKMTIDDFTQY